MGVGIFSDSIFFLKVNALALKEKKKLKNSITLNGGAISFVLNDKCTHAVVTNPATLNNTQKKKIEKHKISVVNPDFIWKSVQEKRLIEVECEDNDEPFEVTVDEVQDKNEKKNLFLAKFMTANKKETLDRDLEEDLEFEDNEDDNIPDDTEVAKYCCFQKEEEYAIVELLCFKGECTFPFRVSTVYGLPNSSQKEFTFHLVDAAEKAGQKYEHRINVVRSKGFTEIDNIPLQAENLASKALQKVLLGEAINIAQLSPEVAGFVESMWVDAIGHLDSILLCPVENISLNDLVKAEGVLCQVRNALVKNLQNVDLHLMMQEFYRIIPQRERRRININMKLLTSKQDLCQVIRDMINVSETRLSGHTPSSAAKYQALRCRIEHIDPNSAEFLQVKQGILDHNHSNRQFDILRVFRVARLSEATNFKSDLGNVKPLLHASSPCNFVGILSRGLLLPKIVVEEFGGERLDIGNLGSGIYFSDSISTSIKYSQPSSVTGSRLLVVCDVALGKCKDVFHRDYTITEPPNGFHSVHGVQCKDGVNSDFTDDEYVVYDLSQIQMRYIVQFSTDGDCVDLQKESLFVSIDQISDHCKSLPEPSEDVSVDDLPDQQVTKGGLKGSDGQQIPLESIHVKGRLVDLSAKIMLFQVYKNNSTFPIEAKYVFPLDSTAAVCGFEAFINGKHIVGEVKEKDQAHREYRTAIREGHGAYLMDQDAPDVFTVSVGNLPPQATVVIKITYVMEVSCQYGSVNFSIPGNVAQWQQDKALKEITQDSVTKVGIESDKAPEGCFHLDMSIEMPMKIEYIASHTHKIKMKKTECKAVIQTEEPSSFGDEGFSMTICLENAYIPRMWVEKHPDKDSEACMLVFQPEFQSWYDDDTYLTICLDCSNSMESCFHSAKQVALLALHSANNSYLNIILFGSNYKEFCFFPTKSYKDDMSKMEQFIKGAKPNMGGTEFWKVLQTLCLLRSKKGHLKVLLISDGHIQNENVVSQILNKNKGHIQLFTCGVGTTTNKHMLRCFAQYSSGAFEYFADKTKSRWKDQMEKHVNRVESTACSAISVKWRQYNQDSSENLQAPANIQAIFHNDVLFVYGFIPRCTQATLKALINDEELENMVSTTELQKTTGTILHTLTARALIKDYEDGVLLEKENENEMKKQEMKSFIIQLSKEYSIVTQFTSFVAVEKRDAEENVDIEPNVDEIISAEDVDFLSYMDWSSPDIDEQRLASKVSRGDISPCSEESSMDDDMGFGLFDDHPSLAYCSVEDYDDLHSLDDSRYEPPSLAYSSVQNCDDSESLGGSGEILSDICYDIPMPAGFSFGRLPAGTALAAPAMAQPSPKVLREIFYEMPMSARFSFGALPDETTLAAPAMAQSSPDMDSLPPPPPPAYYKKPVLAPRSKMLGFVATDRALSLIPHKSHSAADMSNLTPLPPPAPSYMPVSLSAERIVGLSSSLSLEEMRNSAKPAVALSAPLRSISPSEVRSRSSLFGSAQYTYRLSAKHDTSSSSSIFEGCVQRKRKVMSNRISLRRKVVPPSWSSLSSLQSQEGYWLLNVELGTLLNINVTYLTEDFLVNKGIKSLGARGIDTIHKLIATLLALQAIRAHNLLSEIKFKTLMKLYQSISNRLLYPSIEKAIEWAIKSDRQYPGICMRLGLGKDWDQATRQLLRLDPISTTSDLNSVINSLFLV